MAFTYSGDPADSQLDTVRFLISDIDPDDPLLQDEEISWLLTENPNVYRAAAEACEIGAGNAMRLVDTASGELRVSLSQRAQQMRDQAAQLRRVYERHGGTPTPYAGGLSEDELEDDLRDYDLPPSRFWRNMNRDQRGGPYNDRSDRDRFLYDRYRR